MKQELTAGALWVALVVGGCEAVQFREEPIVIYLAAEVDTPEKRELVELIIYEVEDVARAGDWFRADYLTGEQVISIP